MSRFITELENMPLENDVLKLLNDTLKLEQASRKKSRPLIEALYNGGKLPIDIAGNNEIVFNGHQYGDDFETGTRVWRLLDYFDKESEQTYILVAVSYDYSSYDGDDFESAEFRKVQLVERVVQFYE